MSAIIHEGDCLDVMRGMADASVQTCVTSPPYFGLRDYGIDGQIGLEATPEAYVARLVAVFREVRRVLRNDGTVWLNLGDSFASSWPCNRRNIIGAGSLENGKREVRPERMGFGTKEKDLMMMPHRVAIALQADGWWVRADVVWHKPNPMPESVRDRPTRAHEYIFLLTKCKEYYYDAESIAEPAVSVVWPGIGPQHGAARDRGERYEPMRTAKARTVGPNSRMRIDRVPETRKTNTDAAEDVPPTRNKRDVWTVSTKPYKEAHFATFPPALIEPCVLAGAPMGGVVFDPFAGAGTTGLVAITHGRHFIGAELNPAYCEIARQRLATAEASRQPALFAAD